MNIKQCPKCNTEHTKQGTYCSRSCANSRVFSDETRQKKSLALKGKPAVRTDVDSWKKNLSNAHKERFDKRTFEECGWDSKRDRVIKEQDYKCIKCGISDWLGKQLSLEIDHKDGNNCNDSRENLEALCPNCHAQTDTWRGRNKKSVVSLV
jgi:5-methylcytosine-specific restriction endonuclease McrA